MCVCASSYLIEVKFVAKISAPRNNSSPQFARLSTWVSEMNIKQHLHNDIHLEALHTVHVFAGNRTTLLCPLSLSSLNFQAHTSSTLPLRQWHPSVPKVYVGRITHCWCCCCCYLVERTEDGLFKYFSCTIIALELYKHDYDLLISCFHMCMTSACSSLAWCRYNRFRLMNSK